MPTFKEQQSALVDAQHQLAVWESLYKFIDENFIAHDGGPPKKGIAAHDCLVPVVTEDILEGVLQSVTREKILPLKTAIEAIMAQEVVIPRKGN